MRHDAVGVLGAISGSAAKFAFIVVTFLSLPVLNRGMGELLAAGSLYWLPVKERIIFEILLLTFKILHGWAPSYLRNLISVAPEERYNLRRDSQGILLRHPRFIAEKTLGHRAFMFAAPKLWNMLPSDARNACTIDTFKDSFPMSGKSQTLRDFTVSRPSQILPIYRKIARRLNNRRHVYLWEGKTGAKHFRGMVTS